MAGILIKDKSLVCQVPEGELSTHYRTIVWKIVSITSVCEKLIYRLDQVVRDTGNEQAQVYRERMIHYFDLYKQRVMDATMGAQGQRKENSSEKSDQDEFVMDVMARLDHTLDKPTTSFYNSMMRIAKSMDSDYKELITLTGCLANIFTSMERVFYRGVNMLGYGARYPDFIPRGFEMLNLCINNIVKVNDAIIPAGAKPAKELNDEKAVAQYNKLLVKCIDTDTIGRAMKWAGKQSS